MKKLVIYDSNSGSTKKIALNICSDARHYTEVDNLEEYDLIVFVCPTYGDEELSLGMEKFLICLKNKKKFAVCETGNYYGFDDFSFGSRKIIEQLLIGSGWDNIGGFSLDSYKPIKWEAFEKWCNKINERS